MEKKSRQYAIAQNLLEVKAVKLNNQEPFTWASGRKSPIYCDNRVILSYPDFRTLVRDGFAELAASYANRFDVVAGVATGGIAHGALLAQLLNKPFVYIRAEEKKHGMHNRIEGRLEAGQKVLVIEDLVSTGKSSLLAVDALREAQAEVVAMLAIFTYDLAVAHDNFSKAKVELLTLTNYPALIEVAEKENYITSHDLESLRQWSLDPEKWSNERS